MCRKGEDRTFLVRVMYKQNGTWQGQVTWTQKNEKKCFRSLLELIRLMDSAVQSQEEEETLITEE